MLGLIDLRSHAGWPVAPFVCPIVASMLPVVGDLKDARIVVRDYRERGVGAQSFDWERELVERVRSIPGWRWHQRARLWTVPGGTDGIRRVLEVFGVEHVTFQDVGVSTATPRALLLQRFGEALRLKRYSRHTRKSYLGYVRRFLANKADPVIIDTEDLRKFALSLSGEHISRSTHAQGISALRLFATEVLNLPQPNIALPRPRAERKLPKVLTAREIRALLDATSNPKHRAQIALLAGCGIRVGELVSLKLTDIDSERGMLHVRAGKGKKDRYTLYGRATASFVDAYVAQAQPRTWLFPGPNPERHVNTRTVQNVMRQAAERSGVGERLTPHILRHTFATHLLEAGTDIRVIQELLGHESTETTMIYTHVAKTEIARVRSPLDRIVGLGDGGAAAGETGG